MSMWDTLGIAPTDDVRAIKRAYAKQLKVTRPDEQPLEFQALHEAYKTLLAQLKHAAAQQAAPSAASPENSSEALPEHSSQENATGSFPDAGRQGRARERVERNPEEASREAAALAKQAAQREAAERRHAQEREQRLQVMSEVIDKVKAQLELHESYRQPAQWRFISRTPYLLEDDFNRALGAEIARLIVPKLDDAKLLYTLSDGVLLELDQLFSWSNRYYYLNRVLTRDELDLLHERLSRLDERTDHQGAALGGKVVNRVIRPPRVPKLDEYKLAGMLLRALAVALDLFLVYLALNVLYVPFSSDRENAEFHVLVATIPGYIIMAWLMESSPVQATPAKAMLNFRVTNHRFERIGYWHGLARVVSFTLTLATWKIGWLINCFLGGNLMHDRLSRTYVVDVGGSQNGTLMENLREKSARWLRRRQ